MQVGSERFRPAYDTATGSAIPLLAAYGHHNYIKCTKADVRLRTPDDGQKGCPKHAESSYQ